MKFFSRKVGLYLFFSVLLLAVTGYLGAGFYIYNTLADSNSGCGRDCDNTPAHFEEHWSETDFPFNQYAVNYWESVRYPGGDAGIEIDGWWVPISEAGPGEAPVILLVHGVRGSKNDPDMLTVSGMLHQAGFNVLMFDLRDNGASSVEDGKASLGIKEYRDVMASVDWLMNEKGFNEHRIGLYGDSMGAGTAAMSFGMDPRIQAVVLENGYLDLQVLVREELARSGYPTWLAPAAVWSARLFDGLDLNAITPALAFTNHLNRPIFAIHGTADTRVLTHHTRDMVTLGAVEGAKVTAWFTEGAEHSGSKYMYPEEFKQRVATFFSNSLGGTVTPIAP